MDSGLITVSARSELHLLFSPWSHCGVNQGQLLASGSKELGSHLPDPSAETHQQIIVVQNDNSNNVLGNYSLWINERNNSNIVTDGRKELGTLC